MNSELNTYLNSILQKGDIPAFSIVIARDSKILFSNSYGRIEESNMIVDRYTKFDISSLAKVITRISFMQMVDAGLICVDDPLLQIASQNGQQGHIIRPV